MSFFDFIPIVGDLIDVYQDSRNRKTQVNMANQNIEFQKEFAQNAIQWKAKDAQKAGLHPLAALGANTVSYSPVSVGSTSKTNFGQMGQNLSNALSKSFSSIQKQIAKIELAKKYEELKNMKLENVGLQKELDLLNTPSIPNTSQKDPYGLGSQDTNVTATLGYEYKNNQLPTHNKKTPGIEAGVSPGERQVMNSRGWIDLWPNEVTTEAIESDWGKKIKSLISNIMRYGNLVDRYLNPRIKGWQEHIELLSSLRPPGRTKDEVYLMDPFKEYWIPVKKKDAQHWLYIKPPPPHRKFYKGGNRRPIFN